MRANVANVMSLMGPVGLVGLAMVVGCGQIVLGGAGDGGGAPLSQEAGGASKGPGASSGGGGQSSRGNASSGGGTATTGDGTGTGETHCSETSMVLPATVTARDQDGMPLVEVTFTLVGHAASEGAELLRHGEPTGSYRVGADLEPGTYAVRASAQGYTPIVMDSVVVGTDGRACGFPYIPASEIQLTMAAPGSNDQGGWGSASTSATGTTATTAATTAPATTGSGSCDISGGTEPATLTLQSVTTGDAINDAAISVTGHAGNVGVAEGGGKYAFGGNDGSGGFITPGTYTLTISAPGYASLVVPNVTVGFGEHGCGVQDGAPSRLHLDLTPLPVDAAVTTAATTGTVTESTALPAQSTTTTTTHSTGSGSGTGTGTGITNCCLTYSPTPATITVLSLNGVPITDARFVIVGQDASDGVDLLGDAGEATGTYEVGTTPGTYDILVRAPGFRALVVRNVVIGGDPNPCNEEPRPSTVATVRMTPRADGG